MSKLSILIFTILLYSYVKARSFTIQWQNNDGKILATIQVGTIAQPLQVELNFTSNNFYVIDSVCFASTPNCLNNRRGFDKGVSTSFVPSANPFIEYYHGQLQNGFEAADIFEETGIRPPQNLPIGIILTPTGKFEISKADAVMGLGRWNNAGTFTEQFIQQTGSQIFNIYMGSVSYTGNKIQSSGSLTFGSVDTNNCDLDYYYQHLDSQNDWIVKIGHVMLGWDNVRGGSALIDPNQNYIRGPWPAIKILYKQLWAQKDSTSNEYLVDCNRVNSFPNLRIVIHAHEHIVRPSEYIINSGNKCILLIRKRTKKFKAVDWILGLPILRGNCLLFDYAKKRIGFSRHS